MYFLLHNIYHVILNNNSRLFVESTKNETLAGNTPLTVIHWESGVIYLQQRLLEQMGRQEKLA